MKNSYPLAFSTNRIAYSLIVVQGGRRPHARPTLSFLRAGKQLREPWELMLTPWPGVRADCDRGAPMLGVGVYGGNALTG